MTVRRKVGWLVVGAGLGVLARRTLAVVRVQGSSMMPTYADGDRLLAVRPQLTRRIRSGDVVVVLVPATTPADPPEVLVKRVLRVAPDGEQVFVEGDNSPSYDSHVFGALPSSAVIGRVIALVSAA